MLNERLVNPFGHKEVKSRNGLSAVLLVLICLEDDGCQCGVTLYALRSSYASVFSAETPFKQIIHIILYASSSLGWIVVEVMNVYVAQLMCFSKTFGQ